MFYFRQIGKDSKSEISEWQMQAASRSRQVRAGAFSIGSELTCFVTHHISRLQKRFQLCQNYFFLECEFRKGEEQPPRRNRHLHAGGLRLGLELPCSVSYHISHRHYVFQSRQTGLFLEYEIFEWEEQDPRHNR